MRGAGPVMSTVVLLVLAVRVPDEAAAAPVEVVSPQSGGPGQQGAVEGLPLTVPSRIAQQAPPPPPPRLPPRPPPPEQLPVGADVPVDLPLDPEGASTISSAVGVAVKTLVARSELGAVQASRLLLHVKELLGRQLQSDGAADSQ